MCFSSTFLGVGDSDALRITVPLMATYNSQPNQPKRYMGPQQVGTVAVFESIKANLITALECFRICLFITVTVFLALRQEVTL